MIIAFNLLNFDSNNIDGVGYVVKRILNVLQRSDNLNDYLLLVPQHFNCEEVLDIRDTSKFKIIKFPNLNNKIYRVVFKFFVFPFVIHKFDIDVLYSPSPPISPLIPRKIGVVTTINDLSPLCIDRKQGWLYKYYYKYIVKMAICRSNILLTISNNSKNDILRFYHVSPSKIIVMYNFIAGKSFHPYPCNNFFITVCTIQPGKNLDRTMEAFKIFIDSIKDKTFKLYIIGRNGWGAEVLKILPTQLGIADNVVFTDYLDNEKLDWYYQNCAAVIYASLYEGFGLPPLEAMYYGKPSVVSNTSSLPEVVGDAGILVDPLKPVSIAEGMRKIMDNTIRNRLLAEMPDQIRKFDADEQVTTLLKAFEEAFRCHK